VNRVDRSSAWLRSAQGTKALAVTIACLLVSGLSSIGQVNAENRTREAGKISTEVALPDTSTSSTGATSSTVDPLAGSATTLPGTTVATGGTTKTTFGHQAVPSYGLKTQGVTAKEVHVGLTYNVSGCGDSGALSAALGESVTGDPERAFDVFERYINDTGGVNGRKFVLHIADDGSGGCPEKATAAAVKLVDQDKVFLVIPGINEVSDYSIAKKIPTMTGREDDASLKAFGPNGFGLYGIQSALNAWASFAAYYLNSKANVPCLVHPEEPVWNANESTLNKLLAKYGISFKKIIRYNEDVSTAQQQAGTGVAQLRAAGCNQIFFMAYNPIALIFFTSAATEGLFFPDVWTFTSYTALIDSELAGNLMNQKQWSKALGLSYRVPAGHHPAEGNCKNIYKRYNPNDGAGERSAATQLACALLLPAVEAMRRGEKITGELTADSFVVGADSITNDWYFDAHVPMDWSLPAGGPYKTKAMTDWTPVKWNAERNYYEFPNFPLYWKEFGPNRSGGVDLRPLFKKAS